MSLAESIIIGRLDRRFDELETSLRMSGQVFESLPVGLGDTTIEREVLPNGERGIVRISTQESDGLMSSIVRYNNYILKDGQLVTDPSYNFGTPEQRVRGLKKIKILARVAFGRADHWDRETDFYGTFEDED